MTPRAMVMAAALVAVAALPSGPPRARAAGDAVATLPIPGDLIPLEADEDLRAEADEARASELVAKDALAAGRAMETEAKASLEARKSKLEALRKQISLAGSEKREADKKALELERSGEEAARNFYERLLALRQAEAEHQSALMESHRSRAAACERGLALGVQRRKNETTTSVTSSAQLSSLGSNLASAERLYLEATRAWKERDAEAAAREVTVAERRIQAWEALGKVRR
ncbi:MAG: hypothetical protein FD129_550 [bacterium]|nr:MAG: hypothetical protein FD129_550 [bacterium]